MYSTQKCFAAVASLVPFSARIPSQNVADTAGPSPAAVSSAASPIFGVTIPEGYRQWQLVAVSYETAFDEFRGILGNAAALQAYRDGTLPFPDGARFAKLAWKASMGYVALACDLHGEACLTNH